MVGEVPLAPRVEDKEEAREKSRVPPLWRNNSEGSLARARSAHGSSVTPSTGTASVTHSFAKGQPIHSSKFTHSRPRILPSKERFPEASPHRGRSAAARLRERRDRPMRPSSAVNRGPGTTNQPGLGLDVSVRSRPSSAPPKSTGMLTSFSSPLLPSAFESLAEQTAKRRSERKAVRGYTFLGSRGSLIMREPPVRMSVVWTAENPQRRPSVTAAVDLSPAMCGRVVGVQRPSVAEGQEISRSAPSTAPSRRDVVLLCAWLQEALGALEPADEEAETALWDEAMTEVIRQVGVHCEERGRLLELIRLRYLARLTKPPVHAHAAAMDAAASAAANAKLRAAVSTTMSFGAPSGAPAPAALPSPSLLSSSPGADAGGARHRPPPKPPPKP